MVFYCITGHLPFTIPGKTLFDLEMFHRKNRNLKPDIPPSVTAGLKVIIQELLQCDPKRRMELKALSSHPFLVTELPKEAPPTSDGAVAIEPLPKKKKTLSTLRLMSSSEIETFSLEEPLSFLQLTHPQLELKSREGGTGAKKYVTTAKLKRRFSSDPQKSVLDSKINLATKIIDSFGYRKLLPDDINPDDFELFIQTSSASSSSSSSHHQKTSKVIDRSLYSRQLDVLGHEAMQRMATSDVLICGLGGLGVEIAKNVILGGVRSVTLHDVSPCQASDLASQFYLSEADIGKNRAEVSLRNLSELNIHVPVQASSVELTKDFLESFRVVVLTNSSLEEQLRVAEIVRSLGNSLIVAQTRGLFAQVFCDFGDKFTVIDTTGEAPVSTMVETVSKAKEGLVTTLFEHELQTGDHVTFRHMQNMEKLNGCEPQPVKVLGPSTFSIGDTSSFSVSGNDGVVTQVKMPQQVQFKHLAQALDAVNRIHGLELTAGHFFSSPKMLTTALLEEPLRSKK